ncbi:DUF6603 domain-containing protein [Actinomadura scrupuli]|uniref:DUF6603 domain-containing protein n=1 Tax=Actinomadura scrupuli TaxID=559629 RepID=UPI003D98E231
MTSPLQPILAGLLDAFEPLERALHDGVAFGLLARGVGWDKTIEDAVLTQGSLGEVGEAASALLASGRRLLGELGDDQDGTVLLRLLDVLADTRDLVDGLRDLELAGLPDALADPRFWAALALDLPEYLFVRYLERHHGVLFALLLAAGVIEEDLAGSPVPEPGRIPSLRRRLVWDRLGSLVADPAGHVAGLYHWDDGEPFAHAAALDALARIGAALGVGYERLAVRPKLVDDHYGGTPAGARELALPVLKGVTETGFAELGVVLAPVPRTPGGAVDSLFVGNLTWGTVTASAPLRPGWTVTVTGTADATGTVGMRLSPGSAALVAEGVDQRYEIAVEGTPAEPWHLIGTAGATRLDANGLRLVLAFEVTDEPEVVVEVGSLPGPGRGGLTLTVQPGDADSFLGALLGSPLPVDADLTLRWSSRTGVSLSGGGLYVTVPLDKTIGPLTVYSLGIGVTTADGAVTVPVGASLGLALGPFSVRVEDVGLSLKAVPGADDARVPGLGLDIAFKPPTGVGFELDLGDAGHGGGFVAYDPVLRRYSGALALELVTVGLGAIVVIDTRLPGDPAGWALFGSIFATFPSLPLGFGFFLSGVGGLVCLNRTLDADALASGLKSGAIDAILFPDDPLADAPLIISQLDAWFPPAEGGSVFGVAAKITWGAPVPIVTGLLGVALVLPDLEIAVMGGVVMLLPSEEEVLLELHMDSLGVIDLPGRTAMVEASLYDSALLSTIHLSGDMAFYLSLGAGPYFLLAVGGHHPAFDPPCGLPAAVLALDRMRAEIAISDEVSFTLEAYVAVTANTLQFGALAALEASAEYLLTTYTARGSVGFDVLLVFSPFSFSAAFQLGVSVTAGDKELLAVDLAARLDGPDPWYAGGHARFEFLGIDVRFDFEFGGPAQPETPAREDVCGLVVAALDAPAAWHAAQPAWADTTLLVFAADQAEDPAQLWVRPDAELEARQTVAPLDRGLDHYGSFDIEGPTTLTVTGAGIEGVTEEGDWLALSDWFAPAQYDDLTRAEKLAAPSYEEMTTGVRFGAGGLGFDATEATTVVPDYEVRILDDAGTQKVADPPAGAPLAVATAALGLDPARPRAAPTVTSATFAVGAPTWQIFDPAAGATAGSAQTYRAAQLALRAARGADPGSGLCLAPTHAAEAVA